MDWPGSGPVSSEDDDDSDGSSDPDSKVSSGEVGHQYVNQEAQLDSEDSSENDNSTHAVGLLANPFVDVEDSHVNDEIESKKEKEKEKVVPLCPTDEVMNVSVVCTHHNELHLHCVDKGSDVCACSSDSRCKEAHEGSSALCLFVCLPSPDVPDDLGNYFYQVFRHVINKGEGKSSVKKDSDEKDKDEEKKS